MRMFVALCSFKHIEEDEEREEKENDNILISTLFHYLFSLYVCIHVEYKS